MLGHRSGHETRSPRLSRPRRQVVSAVLMPSIAKRRKNHGVERALMPARLLERTFLGVFAVVVSIGKAKHLD